MDLLKINFFYCGNECREILLLITGKYTYAIQKWMKFILVYLGMTKEGYYENLIIF